MTRVLVAYGSKRHGTAGLAGMIGDALVTRDLDVDVGPAHEVGSPDGYDAVIVAGALYANRWHRDARRFVRRHAAALRRLPVWLVSSGPLDDSARTNVLAPVRQVARLGGAHRGPRDGHLRGLPRPRRQRVCGQEAGQDQRPRLARPRPRR